MKIAVAFIALFVGVANGGFGGSSSHHQQYVVTAPHEEKKPEFGDTYRVQGILNIPYAEIVEQFEVYYDGPNNRSRIDYYNHTVETYQLANLHHFGVSLKVVYETTETEWNVRKCFQVNGTANATVSVQSVLPNLDGFTYSHNEKFLGVDCKIWHNVTSYGDRVNTYRFWVQEKDNKTIPVRYEMFGYNSLLGSHYDKYEVVYFPSTYSEEKINADIFNVSHSTDVSACTNFPGPGVEATAVHIVGNNPMQEFISNEDGHVHSQFEDFKDEHDKDYPDHVEHEKRKNTFRQNLRFINSKNRAGLSYSLKANHLADWSDDEFKVLRGRRQSKGYNGGDEFRFEEGQVTDMPEILDWRLFGAVTPVKDQAVCGSCWSFGTVGTIEGSYFVKTGKLKRLSEQALVDCSWGFQNNGCDGGEDFRAYQWIMKHGLPTDADYGPYQGIDGRCHYNATNQANSVFITGYVNVTQGNLHDLQVAIFLHGPISVSIDASQKSFSFYANGVYYDEKCRNDVDGLDHSVLAVGYGVLYGKPYWLIKNSWSTHWGNDGYVLMSQENNNCGVGTQPTYVKLK